MNPCRAVRLVLVLVATSVVAPPAAFSLDIESLKLIVAELPYPSLNFALGVTFSIRQTGLLGLGDPVEALQVADEQLAAGLDNPAAHLRRGMALEALGRDGFHDEYARAVELWQATADRDPEDADARLGLAKALVQAGEIEEAAPLVKDLAVSRPDLWWPHYALARLAMGEFSDLVISADMSADAAAGGEEDPEAFATRVQQIADNALVHADDALKASPGEPAARVLKLLIRTQAALWGAMRGEEGAGLQTLAEMSDELREVAQVCPAEPQIQAFARWTTVCRSLVRSGGAEDLSGLWRYLAPEDQRLLTEGELATNAMVQQEAGRIPDAYELLAVYAMLHGNDREAFDRLAESTRQDPTSPERWEAYIGAMTRTGDLEQIESVLREAIQHVDNGKLRCALAKVHQKRGETEAAEQELAAAIELADDHEPFAHLMLGVLRLKHGNAEGAVEPLQAATEQWTEGGLAEASLALSLALSGKQEAAAEHIARAREISPDKTLYQRAAETIGQ
jgi:tetratricopeptide (TPR) repeat protein